MKIKKSSWHWKAYVQMRSIHERFYSSDTNILFDESEIKNIGLCEYVRMLTVWPLVTLFIMTLCIGFPVLVWISPYLMYGSAVMWNATAWSLGIYGTICVLFAAVVGVFMLIETVSNRMRANDDQTSPEKEPNLVVEYVKARKSKICPIMKVEDE